MIKMLYWSCYIGRVFGGTSFLFDTNSKQYSIDLEAAKILKRNFALFGIWNILALVLAIKRGQNHESLGNFHLTLCFWLGITLLLMVYSLSRFHTPEISNAKNRLTCLLFKIQGKLKNEPDNI